MSKLRRHYIPMDSSGYDHYYYPALRNLFGEIQSDSPSFDGTLQGFDALLGVTMGNDFFHRHPQNDHPLPDDWREFLTTLAGPYGKAILKVYRLRNNLEGENVEQD